MKKNIITLALVAAALLTSGCSTTANPQPADSNTSGITAGDVALTPVYAVGAGLVLVEKAIVGTLTVGVLAGQGVKNLVSSDSNESIKEGPKE
jgi:PBP1b-binding outer membrane lipoprotein LpoB